MRTAIINYLVDEVPVSMMKQVRGTMYDDVPYVDRGDDEWAVCLPLRGQADNLLPLASSCQEGMEDRSASAKTMVAARHHS